MFELLVLGCVWSVRRSECLILRKKETFYGGTCSEKERTVQVDNMAIAAEAMVNWQNYDPSRGLQN